MRLIGNQQSVNTLGKLGVKSCSYSDLSIYQRLSAFFGAYDAYDVSVF